MRYLSFLVSLVAAIFCISCEKLGIDTNPRKSLELTTKATDYVSQGNDFAFDFISRVNDTAQGDFFISPLSMQFLLGMLLDGADGQTADEICSVLGYGAGEVDDVNDYCLSMLKQLPGLDMKTKLEIANAIVVNQNYSLLDKFKTTTKKYFEAEVSNMDFSDATGTANKINKWCSQHTNGLVPKIIDKVEIDDIVYLMNAIYFKSQWKEKFSKNNTAQEPFTREDGSKLDVQMMKQEEDFLYQDNEILRAVCLPYGNWSYTMMVILPAVGKTMGDVIDYLSAESWNAFKRTMVTCDVDLWLPRFESKFEIRLNDLLSSMGMPSAFSPLAANFSAMSDTPLYLSLVQQNAAIKVDEEGTEAAVVSFAGGKAMAAAPGEHVVFHADSPFLYLITESSTGAILFAGKFSGK